MLIVWLMSLYGGEARFCRKLDAVNVCVSLVLSDKMVRLSTWTLICQILVFFSCRNSPEAHFVAQRSFFYISGGLMEFSIKFLWSYKMFPLKFLWMYKNRLKWSNCWRILRVGYVWIPAQIIWSQMNLMRDVWDQISELWKFEMLLRYLLKL